MSLIILPDQREVFSEAELVTLTETCRRASFTPDQTDLFMAHARRVRREHITLQGVLSGVVKITGFVDSVVHFDTLDSGGPGGRDN